MEPAAIWSWAWTMSMEVTSSVTVCSTCMPRVHLDEHVTTIRGNQELDGASVQIANRLCKFEGVGPKLGADDRVEVGRRGDLDDFLVAALDRAIAFVEVDHVAAAVRQHLDLYVASARHGLLEEHSWIPEGCRGLTRCSLDGGP